MRLRSTLAALARFFDQAQAAYGSRRSRRSAASLLLLTLLVSLLLIELNLRGWLPAPLRPRLPTNHFVAVGWTVELLLFFEVIELIFGLAQSMDGALSKQLEVFALILLRTSFEELRHFHEPLDLHHLLDAAFSAPAWAPIWNILADATGALGLYLGLVVYHRQQRRRPVRISEAAFAEFSAEKKVIGLILFGALAWIMAHELYGALTAGQPVNAFSPLFTVLIFSDIAIVFLSMRHCGEFSIVFRNFGYTLVTVFVRLAIGAPPLPRAVMAVGLVLFAATVAWAFNAHAPHDAGEPGDPALMDDSCSVRARGPALSAAPHC